MPLGSSSAAPVTSPGPSVRNSAPIDRSFTAILLSECFPLARNGPPDKDGGAFSFHAPLIFADLNVSPERANDRDSRASFANQGHSSDGAKQDCTDRLGSNRRHPGSPYRSQGAR